MKKELLKVKGLIIDSSSPAEAMALIDLYIEVRNRSGAEVPLPDQHRWMEPAVIAFAKDAKGFVKFVKAVRDEGTTAQYKDSHEFFRRINSRTSQQERRRRLYEGICLIERTLNVKFTFGQKQAVASWLEAYWGRERTVKLDEARAAVDGPRLSTEERAEICERFWEEVDVQLQNNIVPIPSEVVYAKLASLESYKPNVI